MLTHQTFWIACLVICSSLAPVIANELPTIDIWYGDDQSFGLKGSPQRCINVLGKVTASSPIESMSYSLNGGDEQPLSVGPDFRRLARLGDFNVEIDSSDLLEGSNAIEIQANDSQGGISRHTMTVRWHHGRKSLLPYRINWSEHETIQEAVQVVDGLWKLTPEGARTVDPYYDRVLAFGDGSWRNYEVCTRIKFHGIHRPGNRDGGRNVIHAALAARWPGHDLDDHQPHVKWYPLGATCEFMLQMHPKPCRWRILGGRGIKTATTNSQSIEWNMWYEMKLQVFSPEASTTCYRVKIWDAEQSEPEDWSVKSEEGANDVASGGALLLAHYSDVTFGNVLVRPLEGVAAIKEARKSESQEVDSPIE